MGFYSNGLLSQYKSKEKIGKNIVPRLKMLNFSEICIVKM
jgi:hypothetical protein